MSYLAKVHCAGATGQLFGQQPEATDRLSRNGLRFRLSFGSLGQLGTEEFFVFVQKIKAHCLSVLLGPLGAGVTQRSTTYNRFRLILIPLPPRQSTSAKCSGVHDPCQ